MKREGTRKMEKKKKVITVIGRKLWKWDIQMRGQQGKKKSISKKRYQKLKFSQRTKHLGVDLAMRRSAEA